MLLCSMLLHCGNVFALRYVVVDCFPVVVIRAPEMHLRGGGGAPAWGVWVTSDVASIFVSLYMDRGMSIVVRRDL